MIKDIVLAFIPLFVAVDAVGVLPIFISLTEGLPKAKRAKIIFNSVVTGISIAVIFIFLGKAIFRFLNITIGDFMVAGGSVLFCIAIMDMITQKKKARIPDSELGAVPLGTPLIVGPGVLTTSLLMLDLHGLIPTLIAVFANVIIAGITFYSSGGIIKSLGISGSKALSKIMSLFLAAIAVMMIRKGVVFMMNIN